MPEATTKTITHEQASQLLHNKFVVVLGDSIQRSVYKDLVLLLQRDSYLTLSQLKSKGELSFEQDCLVEGGRLGQMTNGTEYREVRQYRTDHHLVRFYFITRIFSRYMESILADFKRDIKPDVVIVNSCVWDVSRYSRRWVSEYKENLNRFFAQLKAILPEESLVMWNVTMPLGRKIIGGFLVPEIEFIGPSLRFDVIEANFYSAMLAKAYELDVLDLHFLFRFSLQHRMKDGVHWNAVAHRQITCFLLAHAAQAWGVELRSHTAIGPAWQQGQRYDGYRPDFYEDEVSTLPQFGTSFEKGRNTSPQATVRPVPATPSCSATNLVMKHKQKRKYNPYTRQKPSRSYRY